MIPGIGSGDGRTDIIFSPYPPKTTTALFQSVACSHGFNDGNKRTAVLLVDLLLERSGYRLRPATDQEDLVGAYEEFAVSVVTDHPDFDYIVAWFRARIMRRER